jgi:hypothetical protein
MTQTLSREIEIEPKHTALIFIDVQKFNCSWDGSEYMGCSGRWNCISRRSP